MSGAVGNSQNIQFLQQSYTQNGGAGINPAPTDKQLLVHSFSAYNGSGSASDIGLGVRLGNTSFKVVTKVGSVYTDITTGLLTPTTQTLFTTTNNDGFLLYAKRPFGFFSAVLTQAQTGSPVYSYSYFNGTAFVPLPLTQTPSFASAPASTYMVFNPPANSWRTGDGGLTSNSSYYAIRILATTAPTQEVKAIGALFARWIQYNSAVANNTRAQVSFVNHPLLLESGELLMPYFSVSSTLNTVEASYQIGG